MLFYKHALAIFTKILLMKRSLLISLSLFTCLSVLADAGINIRRQHAISVFSFSGIDHLQGYKLIQTHVGYYTSPDDPRPYAKLGRIITDDNYTITTQEGGRRWDESDRNIYLSLVDSITGTTIDNFQYYARDYNLHFKIAGVKDGKMQFRIDSTKAVYQYILLNGEDSKAAFGRNRLIFIACSALGFLLLIGSIIRKKNKNIQ